MWRDKVRAVLATTGGKRGEHSMSRGMRRQRNVRMRRGRTSESRWEAGGSHPQAMSDSEEGERGTRRVRWADCEDEEGKEEEEETEVEREEDAEGEKETGQEKVTSEKPPGSVQRRKPATRGRERREERAQEAREMG